MQTRLNIELLPVGIKKLPFFLSFSFIHNPVVLLSSTHGRMEAFHAALASVHETP